MASVTTVRGRRCTKVRRADVTAPANASLPVVTPGPIVPLVTVAAESTPNVSIKGILLGSDIEPEPPAPTAPNAGQQANKETVAPPMPTGKVPEVTVHPEEDDSPVHTQMKSFLVPAAAAAAETPAAVAAGVAALVPPQAPAPAPTPVAAPPPPAPPAPPAPAPAPAPAQAPAPAPAAAKPAPQAPQQQAAAPAPVAAAPKSPAQAPSNNQPAAQAARPNNQQGQQLSSGTDNQASSDNSAGSDAQDQGAASGSGSQVSGGSGSSSGSSAGNANRGSSGGSSNAVAANGLNSQGAAAPGSPVVGVASGSGSSQAGRTDQLASNGQVGSSGSSGINSQAQVNGAAIAQGMQADPVIVNGTPVPQQSGVRGSSPKASGTGAAVNVQGGKNTGGAQVLTKGNLAATGVSGGTIMTTDASGNLVDSSTLDSGSSAQEGGASHVNTGAVAGGISAVVALVMIGALFFFCVRKRGTGNKRRSLENPVPDRFGPTSSGVAGKLTGLFAVLSRKSHRSSRPALSQWTGGSAAGRPRSPRDRASSAPPAAYRDQMRTMMGRRSPSESTVIYPEGRYSRQEQGQPPMIQTSFPAAARRLSASSISQGIYSTSPHDDNDNPFRDPDPAATLRLLNPDKSRLNTPAATPGVALGSPAQDQYFPAVVGRGPTYPTRPMHRRVVSQSPNPFADPSSDPFADPETLRSPVSPLVGSPLSAAAAARIRLSHELQRRSSYNRRSRSIASIPSSIEEEGQSHKYNTPPPLTYSPRSPQSATGQVEQLNSLYAALSPTRPTSHPFSPSIPTPPTPNYDNMAHSPMSPSNRTSTNSSFFNFANNQFGAPSGDAHKHFFYNNHTRPTTGAGLSDVASRVSDPFDLDRPELYSLIRAGSASSGRKSVRSGAGSPAASERKGSYGFGLGIAGVQTKNRDTESPVLGHTAQATPSACEKKGGFFTNMWPTGRTP